MKNQIPFGFEILVESDEQDLINKLQEVTKTMPKGEVLKLKTGVYRPLMIDNLLDFSDPKTLLQAVQEASRYKSLSRKYLNIYIYPNHNQNVLERQKQWMQLLSENLVLQVRPLNIE